MPKGLKQTSSLIMISGSVTESANNTFTDDKVDLQLNALDNEVFVVQSIDLSLGLPDMKTDAVTSTELTLSATERSNVGSLANTNVMAFLRTSISNVGDTCAVFQETKGGETPPANMDYIYILATPDFYANIVGTDNSNPKQGSFRIYGYRARADAATYAALVQSEVLSE